MARRDRRRGTVRGRRGSHAAGRGEVPAASDGVARGLLHECRCQPCRGRSLPGPGGPGRLPAARGRAVALRVEPPGYRRLAPDGLPSLTQHAQAGGAGRDTRRPFSRARGLRASSSVMLRMTDARLAIGPCSQVAALRSARCSRVPNATPGTRQARSRAGETRVHRMATGPKDSAPRNQTASQRGVHVGISRGPCGNACPAITGQSTVEQACPPEPSGRLLRTAVVPRCSGC